jgi:uncharacterized protein (DUF2141 family)
MQHRVSIDSVLSYFLLTQFLFIATGHAAELSVWVSGVSNDRGHVVIDVCTRAEFLGPRCAYHGSTRAKQGTAIVNVASVLPGSYAIQTYNDENDNLTVDRNFFGHPKRGHRLQQQCASAVRAAALRRCRGHRPARRDPNRAAAPLDLALIYRNPTLMLGVRHAPIVFFTPIFRITLERVLTQGPREPTSRRAKSVFPCCIRSADRAAAIGPHIGEKRPPRSAGEFL